MLVTLRDQRFKRGKSLIAIELSIYRVLKYVVFFVVEKQLNSARFIKIISRYFFREVISCKMERRKLHNKVK